jgi:hypothetical protein
MKRQRTFGRMLALAAIVVMTVPAVYGQAPPPYWSGGGQPGAGTVSGTVPTNPYGGTATGVNPYTGAGTGVNPYGGTGTGVNPYASRSVPAAAAGFPSTRGPIVAQPFRAEPPKPLIGERTREEQADPLRVTIEELTGTELEDKAIPVVNSIEEYRAVREAKEPAILFDGDVYIYVDEEDVYKPLNWDVEQTNEELWAEVQYERIVRIQQYQMQRIQAMTARYGGRTMMGQPAGFRAGAYTTPGGGAGMGYSRQPGVGAPSVPSGAMPVRRR